MQCNVVLCDVERREDRCIVNCDTKWCNAGGNYPAKCTRHPHAYKPSAVIMANYIFCCEMY